METNNNMTDNESEKGKGGLRQRLEACTLIDWLLTFAVTALYIGIIIWTGNAWLLIGLPLVFDLYSTRFINWGFWKKPKPGRKPSKILEWVDAIVFALIAVSLLNIFLFQNYQIPTSSLEKSLLVGDHLFVSKVSYGPRMPNTPLSLPMVQNTLPGLNIKSYIEWPSWDYHRLAGTDSVRRGDIVVFNFPAGDTVCLKMTNPDYYSIILGQGINSLQRGDISKIDEFGTAWERNHYLSELGRERIKTPNSPLSEIVWRPVDKRDCYVKRCVGLPGDTIKICHNVVSIDGKVIKEYPDVQHCYRVESSIMLPDRFFSQMEISNEDRQMAGRGPVYILPLTREKAEAVRKMSQIKSIEILDEEPDSMGLSVYPYSFDYPWSRDNFGPLWIPKRGESVALTPATALLYERAITAYEGHTLDVRQGKVYVDGVESESYTFAMDYYFMMGDNRHKSADSRYWGFVPEDHIIGRPLFVWLSLDPDKSGFSSVRTDRIFKTDFDRQW